MFFESWNTDQVLNKSYQVMANHSAVTAFLSTIQHEFINFAHSIGSMFILD